jgi:hypothetical protein
LSEYLCLFSGIIPLFVILPALMECNFIQKCEVC